MNASLKLCLLKLLGFLSGLVLLLSCGMGIKNLTSSPSPTINGVSTSPNQDGTVTVTISGTGFVDGSTVTINSTSCTNVHVLSSTQLTCVLPNGNTALVNIVITSPGGGNSQGSGGGSGGGNAYYTVFVGNTTNASGFGFPAGADAICNTAAQAGSKTKNITTGHWRAILKTTGVSPQSRITFVAGSSIKNTHGDTVLSDSSQLWNFGTLQAPMAYDANGNILAWPLYWTGASSGNDCSSWLSSDVRYLGETGDANATGPTWWDNGNDNCDNNLGNVLCINSNQ